MRTPVLAMAPGRVFKCGFQNKSNPKIGLGYRVWQESEFNGKKIYLWYGHLDDIYGGAGRELKTGDIVGMSGTTGASTAPHLHIQARIKNTSTYLDFKFDEEEPV